MNLLKGFSLKNVLTFQDTSLEIHHDHGLYVIHGQNKDSRLINNTNAVGKSRLFAGIPTVLFETDPLSIKKRNKKDVLKGKTSCMSLDIVNHNGERFLFEQTPSNYVIHTEQDGKFVNINEAGKGVKLEVARTYLNKAFPISEPLFYATCFISDQRNCQFLNATPRDRLAFITDIFGLDIYDQLRKYFTKKLGEVAKAEIEYQTLAKELVTAQTRLSSISWSESDMKKFKSAKRSLATLREELAALYKRIGEFKLAEEKHTKLKSLLDKKKEFTKIFGDLSYAEVESKVAKVESSLKIAESYAEYEEAKADYDKKKKKLTAALSELGKVKESVKFLSSLYDQISNEIEKLSKQQERFETEQEYYQESLTAYTEYVEESKKLISKLVKTPTAKRLKLTADSIEGSMEILRDMYSMAKTTMSIAKRLGDHEHGDSCAVCGSKTSEKQIRNRVASAEQTLNDLTILNEYLSLDAVKKPKKPKGTDVSSQLKSKRKELRAVVEDLDKARKIEDLKSRIDDLVAPKEPKKKPTKSLDKLESMLKSLKSFQTIQMRIKDLGTIDYDKNGHKKIQTQIDAIQSEINQLDIKQRKLDIARIEFENNSSRVSELEEQIETIKPLLKEREQLKLLQTAYAPNNLKLQAAEQIVSELEDSLNRYSSLVFLEPMKFKIRTQKDGISAVVTRNNGESSDIIHLSGAEANCFRLLFFYSLIPLLPENKRTNFLILDEPDSRCSQAIRSHLIREFLPKLQTVVPHVFWITPKSVDDFQDHRLLTVIKEKGVSRLEVS